MDFRRFNYRWLAPAGLLVMWAVVSANAADVTITRCYIEQLGKHAQPVRWCLAQASSMRVVREGNRLALNGTFKGNKIDRYLEIDKAPWFQATSLSSRDFALSDRDRIRFWTLRSDNLKVYKLEEVKIGPDTIPISGEPEEAVEIELKPTGWRAPFWKSRYWFRVSDGCFLRFEGPGDPLATTRITVVMTGCETISVPPPGCTNGSLPD